VKGNKVFLSKDVFAVNSLVVFPRFADQICDFSKKSQIWFPDYSGFHWGESGGWG
jgi:hypothetical protein